MPMPQCRQRPRSSTYETSGMLSYQRVCCPQDMQADGGRTIERRSGTRAATTFRKLPSARPGAKATAARAMSTLPLSAAAVPELRDGPLAGRVRRLLRIARGIRVPGGAERQVGEARQRLHLHALTQRQRVRDDRPFGLRGLSERDVAFREERALEERALVERDTALGDEHEHRRSRRPGSEVAAAAVVCRGVMDG